MSFNDDHDYVKIPLDDYQSPDDHIAAVKAAADGLVNATVEVEYETQWGDTHAQMYVCGYRSLTKEEKAAKRARQREQDAVFEQREREHYERLKEKYG